MRDGRKLSDTAFIQLSYSSEKKIHKATPCHVSQLLLSHLTEIDVQNILISILYMFLIAIKNSNVFIHPIDTRVISHASEVHEHHTCADAGFSIVWKLQLR